MDGYGTDRCTPPRRTLAMSRRSAVTVFACLCLLLAGQAAGAVPASAHTFLVSSTPADGAAQDPPPTEVSLTFSEPVSSELSQVVVTGPRGEPSQDGAPTVDVATVTQPLLTVEAPGEYEVAWRVVASDGHPISGTFSFTTAGAPPTEQAPADEPTDQPPASDDNDQPAAPGTAAPQPDPDAEGSANGLMLTGGLLAGAAALAGTALVVSRRRQPPQGGPGE